jgi:hypothetical protein
MDDSNLKLYQCPSPKCGVVTSRTGEMHAHFPRHFDFVECPIPLDDFSERQQEMLRRGASVVHRNAQGAPEHA